MPDSNSILNAARPLVEAGFAVHLLRPRRKNPVADGWSTAPVPSFDDLRAAYRANQNIGIRTGRPSKVHGYYAYWIDLDIRDPDKAPEAWAALENLIPEARDLPAVVSGSGGESRHLVVFSDKVFSSKVLARGKRKVVIDGKEKAEWEIELFGTGKQVAVPPSIHPSGEPYRWESPVDFELLEMGLGPVIPAERIASWGGVADSDVEAYDPDDLTALVHQRPLDDLPEAKIDKTLERLSIDEWLDSRDNWYRVGMALHHQYEGAGEGYDKWCEWSQQSPKFDPEDQEKVWRSFKGRANPTTFATLLDAVKKIDRELDDLLFKTQADAVRAKPFRFADPARLPRRQWLYGRSYVRQFPSALVAPGGAGKSALTTIEALSMVTDRALLGEADSPKAGPLRVWMVNLEDPLEELQRRMAAACIHYGITEADIGGRLFLDGSEIEICLALEEKSGVKIAEPIVDAIIAEIHAKNIDVMIVDPFVSSHSVSENDNSKIDRVVKTWARIARETNCSIMLVHHVRKAGTGQAEYTADDARGASALVNAARSARVINRMTKDEAEKLNVTNHRLYFRVDDGKANLSPPADNAVWRRLVSVGLGNGSDWSQTDQDHVGVVTEWTLPDPVAEVSEDEAAAIMDAIKVGEWREDSRSAEWVGVAFGQVLGWDHKVKETRVSIGRIIKQWMSEGRLVVEVRKDAKRMDRKFVVSNENREQFGR